MFGNVNANNFKQHPSGKWPTVTPKKLVAASRDSKELRSPSSLKALKLGLNAENKENGMNPATAYTKPDSLETSKASPVARQQKSPGRATRKEEDIDITRVIGNGPIRQSTNPSPEVTPLHNILAPVSAIPHERKPSRLSKRRPSGSKVQKAPAKMSFNSISSSFKKTSRGLLSQDKHNDGNKVDPLEKNYAFVERDGRVSCDDGEPSTQDFSLIHAEI